jgi:hypothetical protein
MNNQPPPLGFALSSKPVRLVIHNRTRGSEKPYFIGFLILWLAERKSIEIEFVEV